MKIVEAGERRRPYRMKARAQAAAETAERILDAAIACFWEEPVGNFSLDQVAERAGVAVQTVIRRFGGKDGLLEAGAARESARIEAQRGRADPGDLAGAIRVLVEHYEELGDAVVKLLAQEGRSPGIDAVVGLGRRSHSRWCERVFDPYLRGLEDPERRRRLSQFVAVCDVYTWKLLRRDSGLGRRETEVALAEMLEGLIGVGAR